MTTFTLEPSRPRLLLAKLCAVLLVALVAVAVGLVLALVANALYGALSGNHVTWGLTVVKVLCLFLLHVFGMLVGFMLGTVFLNTPTAIVLYFVYGFVLPPLFSIGASLMTWFRHLQPWIDFNDAQNPLIQGHLTGEQVAHLATSGALWLVLPMVFGVWRLLRAEVK
jgi:ABC-type transport system involved in multi-copper enzyme maturation permease subunit